MLLSMRINKLVNSYGYLEQIKEPFMLFGGTGYLELALYMDRADEKLGFEVGELVRLVFGECSINCVSSPKIG